MPISGRPALPIAAFGLWSGCSRKSFDARLLRCPVGQCRHLLPANIEKAAAALATDASERKKLVRLGQALLCGHGPNGERYEGPHLAIVPIPDYLGTRPDGRVRRLALVGLGCEETPARDLFEGVAGLLHEAELIDGGAPTQVRLLREDSGGWLHPLLRASVAWESLTPVVLERPEFLRKEWKELGYNVLGAEFREGKRRSKGEIEDRIVERREELVLAALDRLRIAEVLDVEARRAPWRAGSYPATEYRVSGYLRESPRLHVRVKFREAVPGPLIVGRGRYVGFGLMRPVE